MQFTSFAVLSTISSIIPLNLSSSIGLSQRRESGLACSLPLYTLLTTGIIFAIFQSYGKWQLKDLFRILATQLWVPYFFPFFNRNPEINIIQPPLSEFLSCEFSLFTASEVMSTFMFSFIWEIVFITTFPFNTFSFDTDTRSKNSFQILYTAHFSKQMAGNMVVLHIDAVVTFSSIAFYTTDYSQECLNAVSESWAQFLLVLVRVESPSCLLASALLAGLEGPSHRTLLPCPAKAASFPRTTGMLVQGLHLQLPTRKPWTAWTVSHLADEMTYWNQSNVKRRQGSDTCSLVSRNTSVQIQFKRLKHLN